MSAREGLREDQDAEDPQDPRPASARGAGAVAFRDDGILWDAPQVLRAGVDFQVGWR